MLREDGVSICRFRVRRFSFSQASQTASLFPGELIAADVYSIDEAWGT
jgi:hypothetical protein